MVTGVDIAPNLLEQARERAKREAVEVTFDEGDAEERPYGDASFDLVISMFGAMFAPRRELVATELMRICRPCGPIAMANWTAIFPALGSAVDPHSALRTPHSAFLQSC